MRYIDMESWTRREHFELFNNFDNPHFSICANVDISNFYPYVKERGLSITVAIVYMISRAANAIPEFRYRIRDGKVIEHALVHPSSTIMADPDVFSFCTFGYDHEFSRFSTKAAETIADLRKNPTLQDEPGRDDYLFMTSIPWVSFTSFKHPMNLKQSDSVPRFAWGKFFEEGETKKMPLDVQGHHALMDGVHVGKYFETIQEYFDHPEKFLG